MDKKPKPRHRKGLSRIWFALIYSFNGLWFALTQEAAFRQEACIYVLFMIVLYLLPLSMAFKCILFFSSTLVLIVEILNSAIESIVDMTAPGYNDFAKQAKDLGSAAVFLSIILALVLWSFALFLVLTGK
jgi:diacylglycerol kinase (ATP)